jgi:hypothetical protein
LLLQRMSYIYLRASLATTPQSHRTALSILLNKFTVRPENVDEFLKVF